MTDKEIRQLIADVLDYASVPGFRGSNLADEFVAGTRDITFSEIEIDSLAAMEVCIAVETSFGITITPTELPKAGSLNGLIRMVAERATG